MATGFTLYVTFTVESAPEFLGALIVAALPAFLVGSVIAALGLLVFGLPVTWLLSRAGRESGLAYLVAGATGGSIAGLLYTLAAANGSWLGLLLLGPLPGALCGGLWWRFARRDRQAPPTIIADTFE